MTIKESKNTDSLGLKRMVLRVVFETSEIDIETQINEHLKDKNDFDDYTIFGYLEGMNTDMMAYVIGENKKGEIKITYTGYSGGDDTEKVKSLLSLTAKGITSEEATNLLNKAFIEEKI